MPYALNHRAADPPVAYGFHQISTKPEAGCEGT
jgi:hypothetical protein